VLAPYAAELKAELRRSWRTPAYVLPCLLLPVLFYLMFGVMLGRGQTSRYLLATYCVFGAMGPALFGFGVQLAVDRAGGLLTLKRALPVPPLAPLLARLLMAMLFAIAVAVLLIATACGLGGVALTLLQGIGLLAVAAMVALPLGAIGLLIGSHAEPDAAPALVNLVYLSVLPQAFTTIAPLWPTWHAAQLGLRVIGQPAGGNVPMHVGMLVAVTLVCALLATRRLRRIG
jgi:ABC-2 type transport system permease protein